MKKMKETTRALEFIINFLRKEGLKFLIQYGSSINNEGNANDIDIVAICEKTGETENIKLGSIDLIKMNSNAFEFYISNLDPAYCTEPILTGKLIYGAVDEHEHIKQKIISSS